MGWRSAVRGRRVIRMGAPSVLFVDDGCWESFFLLAGGIRKAGIRTVRITSAPWTWGASCLLFDRTIRFNHLTDLVDLARMLSGEQILDIQMTERVAAAVKQGLVEMPDVSQASDWSRRVLMMDKIFVQERLEEIGLFAPLVLRGPDLDASQIMERLGLPVVHKTRTGSGGEGVSIVTSPEKLDALLADGHDPENHFFEQYVDGRQLQFGGVFGGHGFDVAVTFETLQRGEGLAPASHVRLVDDTALLATGLKVVSEFGLTGMMNLNAIRDADGRDWIHDVNPRVFGSFMSFRPAGIDLLQAYVNWVLRIESTSPATTAPAHFRHPTSDVESYPVFPAAFRSHADGETILQSVRRFLRGALPYSGGAGWRYVLYEAGRQLSHELGRLLDRHDQRGTVRGVIRRTKTLILRSRQSGLARQSPHSEP